MSIVRTILMSAAISTVAATAAAETAKVHMGLTPAEFGAFVRRVGWKLSQPVKPGSRYFNIQMPAGRRVAVRFGVCDAANRCNVAMVATFVLPPGPRSNLAYNWNQTDRTSAKYGGNRLAAAYRGFYMRLQQPLYLRGVTDLYLKEMLGVVWTRNRAAFSRYMQGARTRKRGK